MDRREEGESARLHTLLLLPLRLTRFLPHASRARTRPQVFSVSELSQILGTLNLLTSALQALPGVLPQITTVAGLSKRVVELHSLLGAINGAPPPAVQHTQQRQTRSGARTSPTRRRMGSASWRARSR